ncbi:hypothetical protein P1J78_16505 [Psychromarinibacter sp. C21-152]|uniref:Uncharacterized protein n=1 Tax=Psychromarinibacter sediminicola TaxID=3033385 RepID=A0AAE3NXA5_9RHOB|nr:hypothetical protein [Psychromarinibacter sediminicola]MDF0602342.1 hypothetical protein [Psychromarinibacter sediminicola]
MHIHWTALPLAVLLAAPDLPALAQPGDGVICAEREVIVARLREDFGEGPTGGGVMSRDQLMEIWSSPETGSWTALMTFADGTSCIVGSGMNWHQGLPDTVPAGTGL